MASDVPTMCHVKMKKGIGNQHQERVCKKRKEKVDLGRLLVANSVTLATRVKNDILKVGQG